MENMPEMDDRIKSILLMDTYEWSILNKSTEGRFVTSVLWLQFSHRQRICRSSSVCRSSDY